MKNKKFFDFVIGNPPYQKDIQHKGDRAEPVYNEFMDAAFSIANKVELIHPARFLFNGGQTPKAWNEKMLNDPHFKVLKYIQKSNLIFPDTDIKGGVVISYHDASKVFEPIKVFTSYEQLNNLVKKVTFLKERTLDDLVSSRGTYRFTDKFFSDFPSAVERMGKGSGNMVVSNSFVIVPEAFLTEIPENSEGQYIKLLGRVKSERTYRYIKREYIQPNSYINEWKIMLPEANGSGAIGEVLSTPLIGAPLIGATDTFISIGPFQDEKTAQRAFKYIKTKFARVMLGVKKITQHNPKATWHYVPLQDFSANSDIDWSKSIPEIDQQLYKKYNLDDKEIAFIESHVKEMK